MIIRRESSGGSNDLNVVYRPCTVDELIGNEMGKRLLRNALDTKKVHHTNLFTGSAGTGKTTAAKILALGLNCDINGVSSTPCLECRSCKATIEGNNPDVVEINVGKTGGKDHVDNIVKNLLYSPMMSRYKILIFDEAHELTTAAKDLLLTPLEHGYDHVYFIFCTNQPNKLKSKNAEDGEPFLSRCNVVNFTRCSVEEIKGLLRNICEFEGSSYTEEGLDIIAEESAGVPRDAIMWLNQVIVEGSWETKIVKEICSILIEEDAPEVIQLSRLLNKGTFKEALDLYSTIGTISIETMRIIVSGFFVSCLKNSKKIGDAKKYSAILDVITQPIYEQGRLAEHKWINYMFKITDLINSFNRGLNGK